jgi:hypothetical protein
MTAVRVIVSTLIATIDVCLARTLNEASLWQRTTAVPGAAKLFTNIRELAADFLHASE